jgi:Mn-dependent DtxR family transcriptional regulator
MRKTKEICRLAHDVGMSGRAIARALGISNSTVSDALTRLAAAKLSWPEVAEMS